LLKTDSIIDTLIEEDRLIGVLVERVLASPFYEENLFSKIKNYTSAYLEASLNGNENKEIAPEQAYFKFIKSYNKDMRKFAETGKYPLELDSERGTPNRFEYDVILLFSCLCASHRFRIMQLIDNKAETINNGLFIGCGPGLEIELVKSKISRLVAYDFSLDKFPVQQHPEAIFKEEFFDGTNSDEKYDAIYLIELLEHLQKPFELLENCKTALNNKGKIFLTTATNIPQFDHLYNFDASHADFENQVGQLGYKIDFMEDIPHEAMTLDIKAKNRFYVLEYDS